MPFIFPSGKDSFLLSDLIEFKVIERAETNLFRSDKDVRTEAGPWVQFLDTLVTPQYNQQPQNENGLTWERGSSLTKYGSSMRFARWLKVTRGEDIFVAILAPHQYSDGENGKPYMDYRFVVAANNEDLLTTILLYQEQIMQPVAYEDEPWTTPAT